MSNVVKIQKTFELVPSNLEEAMRFAQMIADSDLAPKDYKGKPGNVLIAMVMGGEVGMKAMQSIQNIAVINGRPSIWGDALPALVNVHPQFEFMNETWDETTETATCIIKRRGHEPHRVTFSKLDAHKANLLGKDTYKGYLKRMCQMRARSWAVRDKFPDALKGLTVAEESQDIPQSPEKDMGKADVVADNLHLLQQPQPNMMDLNAALAAKKSVQAEAVRETGQEEMPAVQQSAEDNEDEALAVYLRMLDLCSTPADFATAETKFNALHESVKGRAAECRRVRLQELRRSSATPKPPEQATDMFGGSDNTPPF